MITGHRTEKVLPMKFEILGLERKSNVKTERFCVGDALVIIQYIWIFLSFEYITRPIMG